jgi:Cdc6-like AAA superfamily ATPase
METLLTQATKEGFGVNILNLGMRGVGKTVLTNYLSQHVASSFPTLLAEGVSPIRINCAFKNDSALGWSIARSLNQLTKKTPEIVDSSYDQLWYSLSMAVQRAQETGMNFLLILDEIELSYLHEYGKLIRWAKELNLSTVTNCQSSFAPLVHETIENRKWIDAKIHLKPYTSQQLFDIVKQRIVTAFPKVKPTTDSISLIVDLVSEYDFVRPSTCMEILRLIYPKVVKKKTITPDLIREACFETDLLSDDSFNLISNGSDISSSSLYLASGIVSYFEKYATSAHLTLQELWSRYQLKCEEFGHLSEYEEFEQSLYELERFGWIFPSHHLKDHYYILINPIMMREAVDLLLKYAK